MGKERILKEIKIILSIILIPIVIGIVIGYFTQRLTFTEGMLITGFSSSLSSDLLGQTSTQVPQFEHLSTPILTFTIK